MYFTCIVICKSPLVAPVPVQPTVGLGKTNTITCPVLKVGVTPVPAKLWNLYIQVQESADVICNDVKLATLV